MPKVHNKYHNTAPTGAVYIGRPSVWGNPFSVAEFGREEAIRKHADLVLHNRVLMDLVKEKLAGKDLVCYCAPKACHGDVLLAVANGTPMPPLPRSGNEQEEKADQRI